MDKLPRMNGLPWSSADVLRLTHHYYEDCTNAYIARALERTEYAIHCKLKSLGLNPSDVNTPTIKPIAVPTIIKKETIVNRTVTVKTFIGNKPASNFDVEAILTAIENEDDFIARLRKISTSAAVDKLITKHLNNLQCLNGVLEGKLLDD